MKPILFLFTGTILLFLSAGCGSGNAKRTMNQGLLVDNAATVETRALYENLKQLSGKGVLFGQQDALCYGVKNQNGGCDVKDLTGTYPAVDGFDLGHIADSSNLDGVSFRKMLDLIRKAYSRGAVITLSWHEKNPRSGGGAWDTNPVVREILPGGNLHKQWISRLNLVGNFILQMNDEKGKPIPAIFRPYHEHNGDWFWWGKGSCSAEEYIALWKNTVQYLRDTLHIHQLIYAFSPDRSRMKSPAADSCFLYAYPGDDYVDIIGLDNYWDVGRSSNYILDISRRQQDSLMVTSLRTLANVAAIHHKVPALTETGLEGVKENDWYTSRLLSPLKTDSLTRRIVFVLVWRNATPEHCYVPYTGHPAAEDFINFRKDPFILFEDEMPPMYKIQ